MRVQPLESTRRVGCSQLVKLSWRRENSEKCEVVLPETWEAAFRLLRDELCDLQMRPPPLPQTQSLPWMKSGNQERWRVSPRKVYTPQETWGNTRFVCVCVWVRKRKREKQSWEREREWSCFLNRVAASSFSISGREEKKLGAFWCYIQMFLKISRWTTLMGAKGLAETHSHTHRRSGIFVHKFAMCAVNVFACLRAPVQSESACVFLSA